ncbi:hypothetical protein [Vibrio parahaemolyticus]|uniref:hypothetical protein n=1 Tax=Vibrio parahaemolyticus TaxID=670 RepID=UPI00226B3607|nr:hypothetical protein [Vibrio parahaemolyticus]MCX8809391.1 hypothetical protein [Vibrio parahaemolyticus]
MNKNLTVIGFVMTALYMVGLLSILSDRIGQILVMDLNEVGGFFAGIFGPVAFLWLVLGFLQQGKELQQSTKALELQAAELNESVKQQQELVEVTRAQLEAERNVVELENKRRVEAAKPNFVFLAVGATHSSGKSTFRVNVKNTGSTSTNLNIVFSEPMAHQHPTEVHAWEMSQEVQFQFRFASAIPEESTVTIHYVDALGSSGQSEYRIVKQLTDSPNPSLKVIPKTNS